MALHQVRKRLPTLALKPRGDVTRSLKLGYQWPHNKGLMCSKKILKKVYMANFLTEYPQQFSNQHM